MLSVESVIKRFTRPPRKTCPIDKFRRILDQAKDYATVILEVCPLESRETSLALTKLEEVVFWAQTAIARNE